VKSCLSLTFVLLVLSVVILTCGALFYLSSTAEFTRKDKTAAPATPPPTRTAPAPAATPPSAPAPAR
jgi:predicted membrane channel-forming protein YqfA (hemolysin III family)